MNRCVISMCLAMMALTALAAPESIVKLSRDKFRVINATPEHIIFGLFPTEFPSLDRYNKLYGNFEYVLQELLPGQQMDIVNFERNMARYDRVLWVANIKQKQVLVSSIEGRERKSKNQVAVIPVGSEKTIYIGYSENKFILSKNKEKSKQQSIEYLRVGDVVSQAQCGKSMPQIVDANRS